VTSAMGREEETITFPLTTWTYHKKLWVIEKVILLGFEQDIYIPDEYAGQYHFLSLMSSTRTSLLTTISTHLDNRYRFLISSEGQTPRAANVMEAANHIDSLMAESIGIHELSSALRDFYMLLLYTKLIRQPNRPCGTPELRYELRMRPFLNLSPSEVPTFEDFSADVMPYGPFDEPNDQFEKHIRDPKSELWTKLDEKVKAAKESFAQLKSFGAKGAKAMGVEKAWAKDIQGLLASCIALGVAVAGVKDAVKNATGGDLGIKAEIPEIGSGKRYAEGWAVAKVVKA
jgi:N-alpha-acetyltransferase 35, NatC auxiliary subunit